MNFNPESLVFVESLCNEWREGGSSSRKKWVPPSSAGLLQEETSVSVHWE